MKFKIILLSVILLGTISSVTAQSTIDDAQRQQIMDRAARRRQMEDLQRQDEEVARLRTITERRQTTADLIRNNDNIFIKYKPNLTKEDINAIAVSPEDLRTFAGFLKQPGTGIIRLHSAEICTPEKLVIHATGNCPNNVEGKATGYSFREKDYKIKALSDILFANNKLSSAGIFTIGLLSNLGDIDINNLNLTSNGIKQLAEYEPANDKTEMAKEYQLFTKGVQVGDNIYKRETEVKENNSYVLRSIAYKGKLIAGSGVNKINFLADDNRKDVLVVFRIVRTHEDGSITLLWKELNRKPSPKVVLEEKRGK